MRELKRCPFCGKKDPEIVVYEPDGVKRFRKKYAVLCNYYSGGCGSESGHWGSELEAVAAWNERRKR